MHAHPIQERERENMREICFRKHIWVLFICFCVWLMLCSPASADTFHAENEVIYHYEVVDNGAAITFVENTTETLIIPAKIDGYSVTRLGQNAFTGNTIIKNVTVPGSVKSIYWSFLFATSLETVTLNEGVEIIDTNSFQGCTKLRTINIPQTVKVIGPYAFLRCSSLEQIVLPQGLERIENAAFSDTPIQNIEIPKSVKYIGDNVFTGCSKLKSVVFNEGLEEMGERVFGECDTLSELLLPDSLTKLDRKLTAYCSSLETVVFGKGLKSLPTNTFMGLPPFTRLSTVILPENLERIEKDCISDIFSLDSLYIPPSVTFIHDEGNFTIYSDPTPGGELPIIHGAPGSYALKWAQKHGLKYKVWPMPEYGGDFGNFSRANSYSGQFNDLTNKTTDYKAIITAYEYGLITGKSKSTFGVKDQLTIEQAIEAAVRLRSTYSGDSKLSERASISVKGTYITEAIRKGIIYKGQFKDPKKAITWVEFAKILALTLPSDAMPTKNEIEDGAIPNVSMAADYADAVYTLYRTGVYTGGSKGVFTPNSIVTRSQAAAAIGRMADVRLRKDITLRSVSVTLDKKEFPDISFRTYASAFDKDKNGKLSKAEILAVKEIDVSHRNITSLKGIEYFTSLSYLNCAYNDIKKLDISKNTALVTLYCGNNELSTLDVTKLSKLQRLSLPMNNITKIDISQNRKLRELTVSGNTKLNKLNVATNNELELLSSYNCGLTSINLTRNAKLKTLGISYNAIATIDLSKNVALESLHFDDSFKTLKELDLTNNINLGRLDLGCNYALEKVNASNCLKLWRVAIHAIDSDICHIYLNKKVNLKFISDTEEGVIIYVD